MNKKEYLFDFDKLMKLAHQDYNAGIFFVNVVMKLREVIPDDPERLKESIELAYNIIKNDIMGIINKINKNANFV